MNEIKQNGVTEPLPENINCPLDINSGNTYLHDLCARKAPVDQIREAVTKLGADLKILNKKNLPPLGVAILEGETAAVTALLDLGSPLYQEIDKNLFFNAVMLAVLSGNEEILKTVLEKGGGLYVNLEGIDRLGKKADGLCLHHAVVQHKPHLIPLLVREGAFTDMEGGDRHVTPLQLAAILNLPTPVKPLLQAGAKLDAQNSANGFTALHYAVISKTLIAEVLLDLGADPNAQSKDGHTPLMLAVMDTNVNLVEMLLKFKADPDLRRTDANRETALMIAARKGEASTTNLLLKFKANPLLTDEFNRTAAQIARSTSNPAVALLLENTERDIAEKTFDKSYSRYRP